MSIFFFIPLAVLLIVFALGVILNPNPVRSAMCLVATLFLLAVSFVLLEAHLVAALQVVVYAGAIMVLFLFVIMLLNLQDEVAPEGHLLYRSLSALVAGSFLLLLVLGFVTRGTGLTAEPTPEGFGTVQAVSEALFTRFLLPFEITSLLLLVAIIGAVVMAKKKLS